MKDILREIGLDAGKSRYEFVDSADNIQFCCPFHGETRPSAGIDIYKEYGRCFACDETFTLTKLVAYCLGYVNEFTDHDGKLHEIIGYKEAEEWLEEKFNVDMKELSRDTSKAIMRIDEDDEEEDPKAKRHSINKLQLALYKSGKSTHDYFFSRGFTKETATKFLVGWDKKRQRITVPVLWEDGQPCGIIGRAVIEMSNPKFFKAYKEGNNTKYHIYDNFPTGDILFPLPHFKFRGKRKLAILVEGQYDAMWMHQLGFSDTLSTLTSKIAIKKKSRESKQIDQLHSLGVEEVLLLRDNDEPGDIGTKHDYELLKDSFKVYVTKYPKGKHDPQQLTKQEVNSMIENMTLFAKKKKLRRIND